MTVNGTYWTHVAVGIRQPDRDVELSALIQGRLSAVILDGISHHVENIRHALLCRRHFAAVDLLRDSLAYRRGLVDHVQYGMDHMSAAVDEDIVAGELAHVDLGYVRDELSIGRDFGKEAVKRDLSAVFDVDRLDDM